MVAARIQEAIRAREFAAGAPLPSEAQLSTQFGVSRTVVREAVRMLTAKGLTRVAKGKGIFVRPFSAEMVTDPLHLYLQMHNIRDSVLDVIHARQLIEPPIAATAAVNRTEEDLARLRADIEELRGSEADFHSLGSIDMKFHMDIARASGNSLMPLLLDPIHRMMPEIKSSVYASVNDAKDSALVWHEKVLGMITCRDAEGARQAMTEHLKIAEQHIRKTLRTQ
jgi:GntR family transcriptional repressor for pyruvate dehydrogenase complex